MAFGRGLEDLLIEIALHLRRRLKRQQRLQPGDPLLRGHLLIKLTYLVEDGILMIGRDD